MGHPQPRSWYLLDQRRKPCLVECSDDTTNVTPSPPIVRGILQKPMRMGALCSFSELTGSWCGSHNKFASMMLWGKRLLLKTLSKVAKSHYVELKINYVAGVESQHS